MSSLSFFVVGCGFGEGDGFLGVALWSIPGFQDDQEPASGEGMWPHPKSTCG